MLCIVGYLPYLYIYSLWESNSTKGYLKHCLLCLSQSCYSIKFYLIFIVAVQVNNQSFLVRWNAEQQLLYFYQWRPPRPKGRNCKQFEEVLTSSSPFLSSPTRFNPDRWLGSGHTVCIAVSFQQHHVVWSERNNMHNQRQVQDPVREGVSLEDSISPACFLMNWKCGDHEKEMFTLTQENRYTLVWWEKE